MDEKKITLPHYRFFTNRECEYFPCHETDKPEEFNCLFCYCPLYALGDKCGGNYTYIDDVCKDCSKCKLPHDPKGYDYICKKYPEVMDVALEHHEKKK